MTSQGEMIRCYSRRDSVDPSKGLRKTALSLSLRDFQELPDLCRNCPFVPLCRGGCRCDWALVDTPFGRMDYLADGNNVPGAESFAMTADRPLPVSTST
jgi:radical SAM protein with 4Fe4S-binding SPASM domain